MSAEFSPIGIKQEGSFPNKQTSIELDVCPEETIDYDQTYYIEMTKEHDGWKVGDKLALLGSEYFEYKTADACKQISKEAFSKKETKVSEKVTNLTQDLVKDLLLEEKKEQEVENYKENEINWIDEPFWINAGWDGLKGKMKKIWGHKKKFIDDKTKWFFLAHSGDTIKGKPQLVFETMQRIPLFRKATKTMKETKEEQTKEGGIVLVKVETEIQSFYAFDEKFDKRHDGFQNDSFSMDFWMYRVITPEGKEIFIWTQQKLPNCTCEFKGMLVELEDMAELSRNMKVKSIGKIFFLKDFIPDLKILSPEQLIDYTKTKKIDELDWDLFLNYHPNGNINVFDDDVQLLRSAVILSGKRDGYGLHLGIMGKAGTKKSMGWLETLDYKFSENNNIIGGGNTRAKALTPSFKEKPADIGYFARVERLGLIDELGKMAEMEMNKHQTNILNLFGEWTDLLDCKKRTVGSGNNNTCEIEPTAKHILPTNPVSNKSTIHSHIGVFDDTMMSRILWWVQNERETEFLRSAESVLRISPHTSLRPYKRDESSPHTYTRILGKITDIENRKKEIYLYKCWGKVSRADFLSLFDSCNIFTCNIDENEVEKLKITTLAIAKNPMKDEVWKPRADHHIFLLIDGLVKHRCLFRDFDSTFTPKKEDYDLAERILVRMVKSWDTDLSAKEERGW